MRAYDGQYTGSLNVTIIVNDVNEAPTITGDSEPSFPEESTGQVARYQAADPERRTINWLVGWPDGNDFRISETGALTFASPPDYESPAGANGNEYLVTVRARYDGGNTASLDVTVTVTAVNEPPPPPPPPPRPSNRPPVFADGPRTDRSIAENTAAGENVGAPVVATDSGILTYMLGGADAGSFGIVAATGQIQVGDGTNLDYEGEKNTYGVEVTATDPSGATAMITVTIAVTNLDEAGTVTLSSEKPTVGDDLTATLGDPDGDLTDVTWQWSMSADMDSWMDISGATSMSYTPTSMDVGYHLRATATYTDLLGSGKTARAVSDYAMTAVDPLVARYDANANGTIEKGEVIKAINDYLFGEGDEAISKAEVIELINRYLFG